MSPTRRTLTDLKTAGSLESVPADPEVVANLLHQARNHLSTAAAALTTDTEGAFVLAYDACRKICAALLFALQLRPTGEGSHVTTFQAAAAAAHNFGGRQVVEDAADLRRIRHGSEYRGNIIDTADATDAVDLGRDLLQVLEPAIQRILTAAP